MFRLAYGSQIDNEHPSKSDYPNPEDFESVVFI